MQGSAKKKTIDAHIEVREAPNMLDNSVSRGLKNRNDVPALALGEVTIMSLVISRGLTWRCPRARQIPRHFCSPVHARGRLLKKSSSLTTQFMIGPATIVWDCRCHNLQAVPKL